jgi:hypothetical protein
MKPQKTKVWLTVFGPAIVHVARLFRAVLRHLHLHWPWS